MGRLDDKVIFVAGGGGIGDELARRYVAEGARVVLGDRDRAAAERCVAGIADAGGEAIAVGLDGADERSIADALRLTVERFGGLDGFHANFASFADGALDVGAVEIPLDVYDEMMRVNARGHLLCTRAAVPLMIARGQGCILYTSSGAAHAGEAVRVGYAMSKSATHALMRNVAARYGAAHIRANVIAPGIIMHEKLDAAIGDDFKAWALDRLPLKTRLGTPADIAGVAAMLMSDDGAYVTGQVVSVDGGSTMRS